MVAVVAAAFHRGGRHVVPLGLERDELQRFLERLRHVLGRMLPPCEQMETSAAPERRAVDVAGDALAQQHGDRVLNRVQARRGDRVLVRLHKAQVVVRNHIAVGAGLRVDEPHIRGLDLGVVEFEAFRARLAGLFFRHGSSFAAGRRALHRISTLLRRPRATQCRTASAWSSDSAPRLGGSSRRCARSRRSYDCPVRQSVRQQ